MVTPRRKRSHYVKIKTAWCRPLPALCNKSPDCEPPCRFSSRRDCSCACTCEKKLEASDDCDNNNDDDEACSGAESGAKAVISNMLNRLGG